MSIRSEIVRLGLRRLKRQLHRKSAEQTRRYLERLTARAPQPPAGTQIKTVDAGGVGGEIVTGPGPRAERYVLYLHGGAMRAGAASQYRHFTGRIASGLRACVLAIDYRLAPEHSFPAALDDAVTAYNWLSRRVGAGNILVMGDSAGGGLCFSLVLKLRDLGEALPAGVVALSPWTDLALTGASLHENAKADPMCNADDVPTFADEYLAGVDPRLPYASPCYGDFTGCPPALVHVGSDEILRDDAVRIAEALQRAECPVTIQIWPRMPHVWHAFPPILLPEARRAMKDVGEFAELVFAASVGVQSDHAAGRFTTVQ